MDNGEYLIQPSYFRYDQNDEYFQSAREGIIIFSIEDETCSSYNQDHTLPESCFRNQIMIFLQFLKRTINSGAVIQMISSYSTKMLTPTNEILVQEIRKMCDIIRHS